MKRLFCILLVLLFLFSCGPKTVTPKAEREGVVAIHPTATPSTTDTPQLASPTPAATETSSPILHLHYFVFLLQV